MRSHCSPFWVKRKRDASERSSSEPLRVTWRSACKHTRVRACSAATRQTGPSCFPRHGCVSSKKGLYFELRAAGSFTAGAATGDIAEEA